MPTIGPEIPAHFLAGSTVQENGDGGDEGDAAVTGPQIPSELLNTASNIGSLENDDEDDEDDSYGPSLPPELVASRSAAPKPVAGPSMPPRASAPSRQLDDDSDDDDVGPKPLPPGVLLEDDDPVKEFIAREERRRKQVEEASKPKALKRDEWMLVPPSSSDLLGSLDTTKLKARQFAKTSKPAAKVDNSLWTETPAERQQRIADEVAGKKRRAANAEDVLSPQEIMEERKRQRLDEQLRRGVEEHTRQTRGATLVNMHSKKASSKKDDDKEPSVIWDHSRDMSIGGQLMDEKTRNKMLQDAKGLGSRFGTGKSGGFL